MDPFEVTFTYGSACGGIGGIDLGLDRVGMECRWQIEINEFCNAVLSKHWPLVSRYGDIKELTGEELESVDLVAAGFPCPPVSFAGKGKAQADDRWLWPEIERIIRVVRPRYVLVENVPGLMQRGLSDVLGSLADLGFDAEWTCISAASVGAPQIRDRLFIVAYDAALADTEVFAEWTGLRKDETPTEWWRRLGDSSSSRDQWTIEPDVGRVAYGVFDRLDRLRAIGNAVVPQVAEYVGRRILESVA